MTRLIKDKDAFHRQFKCTEDAIRTEQQLIDSGIKIKTKIDSWRKSARNFKGCGDVKCSACKNLREAVSGYLINPKYRKAYYENRHSKQEQLVLI